MIIIKIIFLPQDEEQDLYIITIRLTLIMKTCWSHLSIKAGDEINSVGP